MTENVWKESRMKGKKGLITALVIVVIVLVFPVSNLIFKPAVMTTLTDAKKGDAAFTRAAEVLQRKCFACHAGGAELPF